MLDHELRPAAGEARGTVLLLHGRGADERDLLGLADQLPDDLRVASVRAPDPLGPGYTWYEIREGPGGSQPDAEDLRRSREAIDDLVAGLDADPAEVGLFGFSQGAVLALTSLVEADYPWAVALHGYLPADVDPTGAEGAAFVAAGEADQVIPPARAADAAERLREAGVDVTHRTYDAGHGIGPAELRDAVAWLRER
jgi:phospholipase/carboxylesterase